MSDEFRVGDRIQGRLSGRSGTATRVETDGEGRQRVWGRQDAAAYNWDDLPADRFILLERPTPVAKFKAGDKARGKAKSVYTTKPREIVYYGANWVIYYYEGDEHAISRRSFDECFEAVPDFFEAGKTYTYAQLRFECAYIEQDAEGRVAIGRTEFDNDPRDYWEMRRQFTPNWKEL